MWKLDSLQIDVIQHIVQINTSLDNWSTKTLLVITLVFT